jgi:hypothetical protein
MDMEIKWKKSDSAVSEVIGAIMMVGIGVALFSVLYFIIMSYPFTPSVPSVGIVGSIQGDSIVLEHRGGDSLDQNATVSFIVGGTRISDTVGFFLNDTNGNHRWDIGEQLVYNYNLSGNMTDLQVEATVVDRDSNSIMMMEVLQKGEITVIPPVIPSLNTSINPISPYHQTSSPLTVNATGDSGLENVTLWYRYSTDNVSWGENENWWNSSWGYRKKHDIGSASGAGSNYQVKIIAKNGTGTDNEDTIYINNKARSDFGDIRFISYSDNTTELDYWIEQKNTGSNATFWVKIPDNLNTTGSSIWVYYGNGAATNKSNGTNTFIFFDDFSGDLSKWTRHKLSGVYPRIENGYLVCGGGTTSGSYGHTVLGSDATYTGFINGIIEGKVYLSSNAIAEVGWRGNYTGNTGYKSRMDARTNEGLSFLRPPYTAWAFFTGCSATRIAVGTGSWKPFNITVNVSSFTIQRDGRTKTCSEIPPSSAYSHAGEISLQNHYGSYSYYDDVRVRKHVSPEPHHGTWGQENNYSLIQSNWIIWNNPNNPDTSPPWSWSFNFPNGKVYYEFYSRGMYAGTVEGAPVSADAKCQKT